MSERMNELDEAMEYVESRGLRAIAKAEDSEALHTFPMQADAFGWANKKELKAFTLYDFRKAQGWFKYNVFRNERGDWSATQDYGWKPPVTDNPPNATPA